MDILTIILTGISSCLTAIVGYWGGWFFTRKKYNTEVDSNLIQNMKQSLEFYKSLADDQKTRLDEYKSECDQLRHELLSYKQDNETLKAEIAELRKQMFSLMQTVCVNLTCTMRQHTEQNRYESTEQ